jgi:hypothetical protein
MRPFSTFRSAGPLKNRSHSSLSRKKRQRINGCVTPRVELGPFWCVRAKQRSASIFRISYITTTTDGCGAADMGTRNIIIYSDGTGQRGGVLVDEDRSNIYKLYRATRCGPDRAVDPAEQVAFSGHRDVATGQRMVGVYLDPLLQSDQPSARSRVNRQHHRLLCGCSPPMAPRRSDIHVWLQPGRLGVRALRYPNANNATAVAGELTLKVVVIRRHAVPPRAYIDRAIGFAEGQVERIVERDLDVATERKREIELSSVAAAHV